MARCEMDGCDELLVAGLCGLFTMGALWLLISELKIMDDDNKSKTPIEVTANSASKLGMFPPGYVPDNLPSNSTAIGGESLSDCWLPAGVIVAILFLVGMIACYVAQQPSRRIEGGGGADDLLLTHDGDADSLNGGEGSNRVSLSAVARGDGSSCHAPESRRGRGASLSGGVAARAHQFSEESDQTATYTDTDTDPDTDSDPDSAISDKKTTMFCNKTAAAKSNNLSDSNGLLVGGLTAQAGACAM